MRYLYLTNPPVSGIFVKRIPMRKKSAKPEALPAQAEVATETANEAPDAAALEATPPPSTKLTDLVRGWITDVEWGLDVVYDPEDQTGYLNTHVPIDGTDYHLYVVAEEGPQYLSLTLCNPLFIPEDRTIEALRLVNHINQRQRVGRMAIVSHHLQYRALIDVEGCEPGIEVLKNLHRNGYHSMRNPQRCQKFNLISDKATTLALLVSGQSARQGGRHATDS